MKPAVQKIFEHPQTPYEKPAGVKPMKVDGWIGPITNGWVRQYQKSLVAKGKKIVKDTRVDRLPPGGGKTAYTILEANFDMAALYPERFESLWGFTDFPPELTTSLYFS
jgi:hypothetical protein